MSRAFRNLLIASALLKLLLAYLADGIAPRLDETEFLAFGRAWLAGEHPGFWRAPGYPWFVAAGLFLGGGKTLVLRLLQVALSVATAWCAYRLARRVGDERRATLAGGIVAFHPSLVAFSHLFWSETLFGFLVLFAFERLLAVRQSGSARATWAAGLLLAAAALTRSTGILLWLAAAGWLAWPARRRPQAGTLLGIGLLVLLPWTIHASRSAGMFVPVDTNGGFNLWSGNNPWIPAGMQGLWSVGLPPQNGLDPRFLAGRPDGDWRRELPGRLRAYGIDDPQGPAAARWYREQAFAEIRSRPAAFVARAPLKLAQWWGADLFLPRHLLRDWYGALPPPAVAALLLLTWAVAAFAMIGGAGGLALLPRGGFRSLAFVWLATLLLLHAATYAHTRMHQPFVPLLVVAACVGWTRPRRLGVAAAALAALAWLVAWPAQVADYLAPSPRHATTARVLALPRHLPLPAARRLDWMLAETAFSAGDRERAARVLAGADETQAWTWYLRALTELERPQRARPLVERALALDGDLLAGWRLLEAVATSQGDARRAADSRRRIAIILGS